MTTYTTTTVFKTKGTRWELTQDMTGEIVGRPFHWLAEMVTKFADGTEAREHAFGASTILKAVDTIEGFLANKPWIEIEPLVSDLHDH